MRLLFEPPTNELKLEASAEELYKLAQMLRQGRESVYENLTVARSEDDVYSTCLSRIILRPVTDRDVRIYVEAGQNLIIIGDVQNLGFFADELEIAASLPPSEHSHIDYFPEHDWMSEESYGLVVQTKEHSGPQ